LDVSAEKIEEVPPFLGCGVSFGGPVEESVRIKGRHGTANQKAIDCVGVQRPFPDYLVLAAETL
jgi:hypothetical protein